MKNKTDWAVYLIIFLMVAVPRIYRSAGEFNFNPLPRTSFTMLDNEGASLLKHSLSAMADQLEDDAIRENKMITRGKAIDAIHRMMHHRVGTVESLEVAYPGAAEELEAKIGTIPEWPSGRNYLVTKLREISEEVR